MSYPIPKELRDLLMDPEDMEKEALAKKGPEAFQFSSPRAQGEFNMWKDWKDNPGYDTLRPLLKSFDPFLKQTAGIYKGKVPIAPEAIDAEVKSRFVDALHNYDPKKGAQLYTHVFNQMKSVRRFITKYQNIGKIPEVRTYKIGEYNRANQALMDRLGREPTTMELSDELKWPMSQVQLLEQENRKDLISTSFADDPMRIESTKEDDVMRLIYYELTLEEQQVFEYMIGMHGKPVKRPGEISQILNMSPSKVSRIIKSIQVKVQSRMG